MKACWTDRERQYLEQNLSKALMDIWEQMSNYEPGLYKIKCNLYLHKGALSETSHKDPVLFNTI